MPSTRRVALRTRLRRERLAGPPGAASVSGTAGIVRGDALGLFVYLDIRTRARVRAELLLVSFYGVGTVALAIGERVEVGRLVPFGKRCLSIELVNCDVRRNQQTPDKHSK